MRVLCLIWRVTLSVGLRCVGRRALPSSLMTQRRRPALPEGTIQCHGSRGQPVKGGRLPARRGPPQAAEVLDAAARSTAVECHSWRDTVPQAPTRPHHPLARAATEA